MLHLLPLIAALTAFEAAPVVRAGEPPTCAVLLDEQDRPVFLSTTAARSTGETVVRDVVLARGDGTAQATLPPVIVAIESRVPL